jgi:DNA excision repair protein ERCC-2
MDESAINRISRRISEIVSSVQRKAVVFFTSYRLMDTVLDRELDIDPLLEQKGMKQDELMALISRFRRSSKPLFGVMGGRISEGINFPGNELQLVIVVGIPYPRPDAKQKALQAYYEHRFHNGWEYSVTFPVVVKLRQAIGRLIRSSDDTGVAVILDKRATYFQKYIPEMRLSRDPGGDALNFFNEIEGNPK